MTVCWSSDNHLRLELLDTSGGIRPVADAEDGVEYESARTRLGGRLTIAALEVLATVRVVREKLSVVRTC